MTIRRATTADAQAIAEVHVHSWQWAYRGLLPDDYLDSLSSTLDLRVEAHARRLADDATEERTWVAEQESRIVGFACTGPSRDPDASTRTGAVGAIYLQRGAAGKGVGAALFTHAIRDLWRRGYEQATLWVLENNVRARRFYETAGWIDDGTTKTENWPDVVLHEVRYRVSARPEDNEGRAASTGP